MTSRSSPISIKPRSSYLVRPYIYMLGVQIPAIVKPEEPKWPSGRSTQRLLTDTDSAYNQPGYRSGEKSNPTVSTLSP